MSLYRPTKKVTQAAWLWLVFSSAPSMSVNIETNMEAHQHQQVEVPNHMPKPQLSVTLWPDTLSGYNLHVQLVNYRIEPPDQIVADNESAELLNGHAHLFVNGIKIRRLYGLYTHVSGELLNPGVNNIAVTLNSHQHDTWTVSDRPLTSSVTIDTKQVESILYEFSSSPILETVN